MAGVALRDRVREPVTTPESYTKSTGKPRRPDGAPSLGPRQVARRLRLTAGPLAPVAFPLTSNHLAGE